jgi:hypothetical protein
MGGLVNKKKKLVREYQKNYNERSRKKFLKKHNPDLYVLELFLEDFYNSKPLSRIPDSHIPDLNNRCVKMLTYFKSSFGASIVRIKKHLDIQDSYALRAEMRVIQKKHGLLDKVRQGRYILNEEGERVLRAILKANELSKT